jgi:anti-sigma B factor antagonist
MAELDGEASAEVGISVRADPQGVPVVSLAGELDSSNVGTLDAAMASVTAEHPKQLIFDLGALRFMDSAGIAVLVRAAAEVDTLQIHDPSPIVRRIIEVTGLSGVLRVEP